jgi:hypothetical protein
MGIRQAYQLPGSRLKTASVPEATEMAAVSI